MLLEEDAVRLRHMLDSAREAIGFATERTREDLDTDRQLVHSLMHCVEIIGEAAGRISDARRESMQGVPWSDIIGMRNRLIHAYYDVNLNILWRTVREELPVLVEILESALNDEGASI